MKLAVRFGDGVGEVGFQLRILDITQLSGISFYSISYFTLQDSMEMILNKSDR